MRHRRKKGLNLLGKYKISSDSAKTDFGKFAIKALKFCLTVIGGSMGSSEQMRKEKEINDEITARRIRHDIINRSNLW